jgi:hypothetical protein
MLLGYQGIRDVFDVWQVPVLGRSRTLEGSPRVRLSTSNITLTPAFWKYLKNALSVCSVCARIAILFMDLLHHTHILIASLCLSNIFTFTSVTGVIIASLLQLHCFTSHKCPMLVQAGEPGGDVAGNGEGSPGNP